MESSPLNVGALGNSSQLRLSHHQQNSSCILITYGQGAPPLTTSLFLHCFGPEHFHPVQTNSYPGEYIRAIWG